MMSFHSRDWKPLPCKVASLGIFLCEHKSNIKMAEILVSSTFFKRETFTDLELWKGTDFFCLFSAINLSSSNLLICNPFLSLPEIVSYIVCAFEAKGNDAVLLY